MIQILDATPNGQEILRQLFPGNGKVKVERIPTPRISQAPAPQDTAIRTPYAINGGRCSGR